VRDTKVTHLIRVYVCVCVRLVTDSCLLQDTFVWAFFSAPFLPPLGLVGRGVFEGISFELLALVLWLGLRLEVPPLCP